MALCVTQTKIMLSQILDIQRYVELFLETHRSKDVEINVTLSHVVLVCLIYIRSCAFQLLFDLCEYWWFFFFLYFETTAS